MEPIHLVAWAFWAAIALNTFAIIAAIGIAILGGVYRLVRVL